METYTKLCLVCGKEFVKPYSCSSADWENERKNCSRRCSDEWRKGKSFSPSTQFKEGHSFGVRFQKGERISPKTEFKKGLIPWNKDKTIRKVRNCGYCQKEFLARLAGKGLYCSYECRGLAQKANNPWKNCVVCETPFQKKENVKRWEVRKVCSRKCQYEIQGEPFRGEKNHNYKGGITPLMNQIRGLTKYRHWFREIFRRDNWACQLCGARSGNGKKIILNADHYPRAFSIIIKENKIDSIEKALNCIELWDLNNGRTLCVPCHKIETAKLKKTL